MHKVPIFLVLAALSALPVFADPVYLRCMITDGYLTKDYGPELQRAQRELCAKLTALLDERSLLLAWQYIPDTGAQPPPKPALVLILSNEGQRREMTLRLEPKISSTPLWEQARTWKQPGDTGSDPLLRRAADYFAGRVRELLVVPFEETLASRLKGIPLSAASWSPDGPPRVASELPWEGNEDLRASCFRVSCQHSNGGFAEDFESLARGTENGKYSLEATYRLSDMKRVGEILHEVKQFHPRWLFLLQFQRPDDTDYFTVDPNKRNPCGAQLSRF